MKYFLLIGFICASVFAGAQNYTTVFPLTQNPLSENGAWIDGGTSAGSNNVQTSPGRAFGTEAGSANPHGDSIAVLTGTWDPDQTVEGKIFVAVKPTRSCGQEVELHLRTTIAPDSITGYEVFYSTAFGSTGLVRWDGAQGNYKILKLLPGVTMGNGDVIKASVDSNNTFRVYKNGNLLMTVTDSVYTSGSPGVGMNSTMNPGCLISEERNYGLASFTATAGDVVATTPPPPPAPPPCSVQEGSGQVRASEGHREATR